MNFTVLDLTVQCNSILSRNEPLIKTATEESKRDNNTFAISKAVGTCRTELWKEITRQLAIYTKEEEDAITSLKKYHEGIKTFYTQAEFLLKQLEKQWDEKKAQEIVLMASGAKKGVEAIAAIRKGMVAHQDLRAGFCNENNAKALLSERTFNELNTYYLGLRAPMIPKLAELKDKDVKSAEHATRIENMVKLFPALKKEAASGEALLKELKNEYENLAKLKEDVTVNIVSKTSSIKDNIYTPCKNHSKTPCKPDLVKNMQATIADHETRYKQTKSKLKTLEELKNTVLKRAAAAKCEKDKEVLSKFKQMESDIKEMDKLLTTYDSERKKAAEELKKVMTAIEKAKQK